MLDPVTALDGVDYDRSAIIAWFRLHIKSPVTGKNLANKDLKHNPSLRQAIQKYRDHQLNERLQALQLGSK